MFRLSILDIPCRVLINAEITVRQAVLTVSAAYEAKVKISDLYVFKGLKESISPLRIVVALCLG